MRLRGVIVSFARPPVVTVRPPVRPACPVLGSSCRLSPDMRLIDHCELPNGPSLHSALLSLLLLLLPVVLVAKGPRLCQEKSVNAVN